MDIPQALQPLNLPIDGDDQPPSGENGPAAFATLYERHVSTSSGSCGHGARPKAASDLTAATSNGRRQHRPVPTGPAGSPHGSSGSRGTPTSTPVAVRGRRRSSLTPTFWPPVGVWRIGHRAERRWVLGL
jgi:hypothetical protein